MRRALATTLLTLACAAAPAAADTLHLHDGRVVTGTLKRGGTNSWLVTAPGRRPAVVPDSDVALIELTPKPTTGPAGARDRLDALRRSVAGADDAADAVAKYQRFIDGGPDAASLAAARQDVAVWQDRADRHLVRLGDRWGAAGRPRPGRGRLAVDGRPRPPGR